MQRKHLTALAVLAVTLAATTGAATAQRERRQPAGSPAAFLTQIVRLIVANRYAQAWVSLNPRQQARAPLDTYVACEAQSPIPGHLTSLRILRVRHELVQIVPDQAPVAGTAVTFAFRLAGAAVPEGVPVVLTAHAVAEGARWTWIVPPARLQRYRNGCETRRPSA